MQGKEEALSQLANWHVWVLGASESQTYGLSLGSEEIVQLLHLPSCRTHPIFLTTACSDLLV